MDFDAKVSVGRITNTAGTEVVAYSADITIHCVACKVPMQFLGLPVGLDLRGAMVSPDGLEARLGMLPQGEVPGPLGLPGFRIKGPETTPPGSH